MLKILLAKNGDNLRIFVCFLKVKRARRAFSFKWLSATENLPVEEISVLS